mmetsp:Transcript_24881/g.56712  ORF Transcript_24881/g.56712 Transcript_24881/m.56712 type:complete len:112 (+) Transcript_24881:817-1152(+)
MRLHRGGISTSCSLQPLEDHESHQAAARTSTEAHNMQWDPAAAAKCCFKVSGGVVAKAPDKRLTDIESAPRSNSIDIPPERMLISKVAQLLRTLTHLFKEGSTSFSVQLAR